MTISDRAEAYNESFAYRPFGRYPASRLWPVLEKGETVLYGLWKIGNDYRNKSALYGAYPRGFMDRVWALFPDLRADRRVLHAFSGSLQPGPYVRLDRNPARRPDVVGDVCAAPFPDASFDLIFADPPYSKADAEEYDTPMIDRRKALVELARITVSGGFLVWLDCVWPMFRREEWRTVAHIALVRSTNHRVRLVSVFERTQP